MTFRFHVLAGSCLAALLVLVAGGLFAQVGTTTGAIDEQWKTSPHANIASEAFTHWDKEGAVPVACATCHSGGGFRDFLGADGSTPGVVDRPAPVRSAIGCNACHNPQAEALAKVSFPSGAVVEGAGRSAVCMVCHQGRQSGGHVQKAVTGISPDVADPKLRFINIHYRAAAATLFGTDTKGGFEYPGRRYQGRFAHVRDFNTCTGCHESHTTKVKDEKCGTCHAGKAVRDIRRTKVDFDGNGTTSEGIHAEVAAIHALLGQAINAYARTVTRQPVAYSSATFPYFFADRNGNGQVDKDELDPKNPYAHWTPRLLQAAYNYQFAAKDPGAYSHNPKYVLQLMFDSLASLSEKVEVPEARKLRRP